jgi:hypothetical protein
LNLTTSGLEVTQSQLIGYSSYAGIGTNGLAVAGNVGIGTSSPASKLQVAGQVRISGVSAGSSALVIPAGDIVGDVSSGAFAIGNYGDASSEMRISTRGFTTFRTGATDGTNGPERMRLDSSGNLGLGVTPSAWNANNASVIQLQNNANIFTRSTGAFVTSNFVYDSSDTGVFQANGYGIMYQQNKTAGTHVWLNTANNTSGAGAIASLISAMTLDASGNLLVGKTSAGATGGLELVANVAGLGFGRLYLNTGYGSPANSVVFAYNGTGVGLIQQGTASTSYYTNGNATSGYTAPDGNTLALLTNATERARISSDGTFRVKGAGTAGSTDAVQFSGSAPASVLTLDAGGRLYLGAISSALANQNILTGGQGGGVQLIRNASTNVTSGQSLGTFAWKGSDSANSNTSAEAMIEAVAAENFTGFTAATNLLFYTKPTGTGPGSAPTERGQFSSDGTFRVKGAGIAGSTDAFQVSGSAPADAARITSGGDLLVGTTSNGFVNGWSASLRANSVGDVLINHPNTSGSGQAYAQFGYNGASIGSITQDGTTGVLYNLTSDRRLKDNIVPAPSASDDIDAIQIVSHDWKSAPDEHVKYGVIAQDLHAIAPQAVLQGDDGDEIEKTWGVDYSKLVPMLIKEIQSLRARLAAAGI